jgi:5-methylcytosine-specific restriction endonuclease McrA
VTPIQKPARRAPKPRRPIRRRVSPAAKRRAAKAAGHVDLFSWQAVLEWYAFKCAYCGAPWQEMEHCQPLSRGGAHAIHNVCPSCRRCNRNKGTRTAWPERRHPFMKQGEGD